VLSPFSFRSQETQPSQEASRRAAGNTCYTNHSLLYVTRMYHKDPPRTCSSSPYRPPHPPSHHLYTLDAQYNPARPAQETQKTGIVLITSKVMWSSNSRQILLIKRQKLYYIHRPISMFINVSLSLVCGRCFLLLDLLALARNPGLEIVIDGKACCSTKLSYNIYGYDMVVV
jgi:hypothetical protein